MAFRPTCNLFPEEAIDFPTTGKAVVRELTTREWKMFGEACGPQAAQSGCYAVRQMGGYISFFCTVCRSKKRPQDSKFSSGPQVSEDHCETVAHITNVRTDWVANEHQAKIVRDHYNIHEKNVEAAQAANAAFWEAKKAKKIAAEAKGRATKRLQAAEADGIWPPSDFLGPPMASGQAHLAEAVYDDPRKGELVEMTQAELGAIAALGCEATHVMEMAAEVERKILEKCGDSENLD